nr:MAG TPA: protein of unknown function (DUF4326) [Caudoviricetes sp.]
MSLEELSKKIQVIHIRNIPSSKTVKSENKIHGHQACCHNNIDLFNTDNIGPKKLYAYIGRSSSSRTSSVMDNSFSALCNPFRLEVDNVENRKMVIDKFRQYAYKQMQFKTGFYQKIQELVKLLKDEQYDVIYLVCFCKPKDCHGDVVKELVLQEFLKQHQ